MSSSDLIYYFMIMGISMYREFVNRYPITVKQSRPSPSAQHFNPFR